MRTMILAASAALFLASAGAQAASDSWGVRPTLDKQRSAGNCTDNAGNATLVVQGNVLTYKSSGGSYNLRLAPDGSVKDEFKTLNGNRLQVTGNVRTRTIEFHNQDFGCTYKVLPTSS